MLGLGYYRGVSLVEASGGCSLVAVFGLLVGGASLVSEHGPNGTCTSVAVTLAFSSCGFQAQELWRMGLAAPWHVGSSRSRIKPMSPGLADGFFTTEPPGKSRDGYFCLFCFSPPEYELYFLVSWYDFSLSVEY